MTVYFERVAYKQLFELSQQTTVDFLKPPQMPDMQGGSTNFFFPVVG